MRKHVWGTLSVVQEERFQLVDDRGVAHLFLVASGLALKPADLRAFLRDRQEVTVEYEESPTLIARIATAIRIGRVVEESSL